MPLTLYGIQNHVMEWAYTSAFTYDDPFNDVEMDVVFTAENGKTWRVPAYWAGDQEWRVRFAAHQPGTYRFKTLCSDEENTGLHGVEGSITIKPYRGENPLFRHGPIRISENKRYFEHADGTPFFWLGDTWWFSLSKRLQWPDEFQELTEDRVEKGFTVIQLVAGFYPDMPEFDARNENESSFCWRPGYKTINPSYFDMADLRIRWLVKKGMVPCIFGSWGYHILWTGVERMKKYWRNLVARYGAYPVVWCLAGEGSAPYFLSKTPEEDSQMQKKLWTEVGRYVRSIDPYHRPMTIHTRHYGVSREEVEDAEILDFDMPQAGHGGYDHMPWAARLIAETVRKKPEMPVVNGEVMYEGSFEVSSPQVQRFVFWSAMLSGAAGHTYGASGLWQLNREGDLFGASPCGASWGETLWEEAYRFPGSTHVGIGKKLLTKFEWWKLEPHPEWVEPNAGGEDYTKPYAAGIEDRVRIFYFPGPVHPWSPAIWIKRLDPNSSYRGCFYSPVNGREYPVGKIEPDAEGTWRLPLPPVMHDWVLVLEEIK